MISIDRTIYRRVKCSYTTKVAEQVDVAFPSNKSVKITAKGEPVLKCLKAQAVLASLRALQEALHQEIPNCSVLDVLWDTNKENHWTRHFGPTCEVRLNAVRMD